MRKKVRIPAMLALTLALAVPALAQSAHDHHAASAATSAPAATTDAAKAPATVDPGKTDLLRQEYVATTAALRGKITARQATLETQLATTPDDVAAVKKLTAEISALRGQLLEQTTLFRIRYAKETGQPIRLTRAMSHMPDGDTMSGAHDGMKMGGGMKMGSQGGMKGHGMDVCGKKGGMAGHDKMAGHGSMTGMQTPAPATADSTSAAPASDIAPAAKVASAATTN